MAGYTRQSTADIMAGEVVRAAPINAEFDELAGAFNGVSGHEHDGTTGNGPRIDLSTSVSSQLPVINGGTGVQTYEDLILALELEPGVDVQPFDADLAAIAALAGTGLAVRTAANTWGQRNIVGTATEITVTNGDTIGGNPTISLPTALTFSGKTVTGGTFNATTLTGNGAGITSLNASNLTTGEISDARHGDRGGGSLHANATTVSAGFMSASDKTTLDSLAGTTAIPTGSITLFATSVVPTGFLECNGAAVSRVTYGNLFALLGTGWGAGDGSTTFNVPDLRGQFVRGWDNGRGIDPGRGFATSQIDQIKAHGHAGSTAATDPGHTHVASAANAGNHAHNLSINAVGDHTHGGYTDAQGTHSHGGATTGGGAHRHQVRYASSTGGGINVINTNTGTGGVSYQDGNNGPLISDVGDHVHGIVADGNHAHNIATYGAGGHTHSGITDTQGLHSHTITVNSGGAHTHVLTIASFGGNETRPMNVALMYIIKT